MIHGGLYMAEKTTNLFDKLNSVQGTRELNNYIKSLENESISPTFAGYISYIVSSKDLSRSEVISKSLIERTYGYQIFNGTKKAGRDKIIALCVAADMSLDEVQRGLEIAKEGILYPRDARDSLIIFAVNNHYSVHKLNNLLAEQSFDALS